MARGEHLKDPVITNNDAIVKVQMFTREGKRTFVFECKNYISNTHPSQRVNMIKEALEAKMGKLHDVS